MLVRTPLLIEMDLVQQRQDERDRRRRRRTDAERKRTRILFHTAKKPAQPRPAQSQMARQTGPSGYRDPKTSPPEGNWERSGRKPTKTGAFLTNNPQRVAPMHGIFGHVYAYEVPEKTIRKSGGIRTYDKATEILVPGDQWKHVKFRGKSLDKKKLNQQVDQDMTKHWWGIPKWAERKKSKAQKKRDRKAADIERREQGRKKVQAASVETSRTLLVLEALKVRRQSVAERMAKRRPAATLGAARASKWLWQKMRKQWSKDHPQYIFRKGKLIFVPPEKRRQLKSKIKGRIVMRAELPGAGTN